MGRRLTALSNNTDSITYSYDASGQRVSKTINGVTTSFYYDDRGVLILSSNSDGTELRFYADAEGNIDSFSYNNEQFYYVRNAQNDVIGITDSTGAFVARYTYDEWGNITAITDGNGVDVSTNPSHIANLNPLRYRSYFYDSETGFYWLNTRYYDPEIGRFLNADGALYYGIIYNLYSYCYNNPIIFCDCKGNCAHTALGNDCRDCLAGIVQDEEEYHSNDFSTGFDDEDNQLAIIDHKVPPDHPDYKPPKKGGGKKVKNPNGPGWGWPADDGGVWIPTPNMHGGEGWTVQYPDGSHSHAYPGGNVRHHYQQPESNIAAIGTITVSVIAIIALLADDVTLVGVLNDGLVVGCVASIVSCSAFLTADSECTECY